MATLPETMIAIDPEGPGGPEVLRAVERPIPRPGADEVLIKVEAAGVNRPDVMQRRGLYPPPPGAPSIPGLEVSGRIVAVGPAMSAQWIGKRVCALVAGGGYAQYCLAPVSVCLNTPGPVSMIEAAALPEAMFTVWHNLFQRGQAKRGDTVLVHGGTSGIGVTAIQLGRLFELDVIVTAGSDDKCARALEIGAAQAINYNKLDFAEAVKTITAGAGVQVVLDMVGGDYLVRNLQCLAEDGIHVSIAAQRGATPELPLWDLMRRRLTLTGSTLRARSVEFKTALALEIQKKVWPLLETDRFRPVIDSTFPLSQAADAHRRMESGAHVGKIVLQIGDYP